LSTHRNKIFFASDFHLGVPDYVSSLEREKIICNWLESIKAEAKEIFLMGDLFDFWFEHNYTAPKGYVRILGKIAEITDAGIPVHLFTGNHDMWMFGYLEKELNVKIHRNAILREFEGKKFYLAHGDGLGPGDRIYKIYKWFFISPFWQWCFARLHPNFSMWLGQWFSNTSRKNNRGKDKKYLGDDQEFLVQFCKQQLQKEYYDYFIFGHRHLPIDIRVGATSRYLNLGEWMNYRSYAVFENGKLELKYFNT
jgi:UDP-2,3-diacylglucosamine hydrolase